MRAREFIMKDLYSFDRDFEGLRVSYEKMYNAYCRVFSRCGLSYKIVLAESGVIGGEVSHEFLIPADSGEENSWYARLAISAPPKRRQNALTVEIAWKRRGNRGRSYISTRNQIQ